MAYKNRGLVTGAGWKNRGSVITGGSFTNRGSEDQSGRPFQNRGQDWFGGDFKNRGQSLLTSSVSWSPTSLFASSEVGVWYDPSDLTTMFQDSVGTTPVTATGDPVGLILDKSQGLVLGPELVTNGGFDTDTTGWTADVLTATSLPTLSVEAGRLRITATAIGSYGVARTSFTTVAGKWYKLSFEHLRAQSDGTGYVLRIGTTVLGYDVGNFSVSSGFSLGTKTYFFKATTTTTHVCLGHNSISTIGDYCELDNVSVKALPGNHATQATAASRPLLDTANLINYDGVDDLLIASNPDLGTAVTIARATGGGVSILTAQTVGANYVDNTDHYGLVIVNKALTAGETTSLTTYLEGFIP